MFRHSFIRHSNLIRHSSFVIRHWPSIIRHFLFFALALTLPACGHRTIRVDLVPTEDHLTPQTVEYGDANIFTLDKIAMVNVSGLISNSKPKGILASGTNPVSDFRETLDAIARDPTVKAVLLRINSPGGTVAASQMMYRDLLAFKAKTHKPVVVCMMDLCASGGYYVSCAADYRVAYPTSVTGSIGVIVETLNLHGTLNKLGIAADTVKSGPNKDMLSPFKPPATTQHALSATDRELMQHLVDQFYTGFKAIVKSSPNHIADSDWQMVTDGRVFTGVDAQRLGLIDEVGDLDAAIAKAKEMAHIQKAKIVAYTRSDELKGSIYASAPNQPQPQVNMINVNLDIDSLFPVGQSQFMYLWPGFDLSNSP